MQKQIMDWLLEGDPSIRWQVLRDLTDSSQDQINKERQKIAKEGWGARLLAEQDQSGMWADGLYSPKWISTTYTMLLLRRLGLSGNNKQAMKTCQILLDKGLYQDGGINYFKSLDHSETCVTGMVLSILAHFELDDSRITHIVEHLLVQQMSDGGWNCESYNGARHSSFHTTISVLEGLREFEKQNPEWSNILAESQERAREFLLIHRLFRSHTTGEVVDVRMTRFSFPPRWRYDIMRALDYFQDCDAVYDERLDDAVEIFKKKRRKDGRWLRQNKHPGRVYFDMEKVGKPSRWNTLRALRILKWLNRNNIAEEFARGN